MTFLSVVTVLSSPQSNSPIPNDEVQGTHKEQVVPVSELKATIAHKHMASQSGNNEKDRLTECLSVDFVAETTGPLVSV